MPTNQHSRLSTAAACSNACVCGSLAPHLGAKSLSSSPSSPSLSLWSASKKDQPPSSMKASGS